MIQLTDDGAMSEADEARFIKFLEENYPPILSLAQFQEAFDRFDAGEGQ
jgi:hypothetical protein